MSEDCEYYIRSWNSTYYISPLSKWTEGLLCISSDCLQFKSDSSDSLKNEVGCSFESNVLSLTFSQILEINKSMSSFVFPAIKITEKSGKIHWFASFMNREEVFLLLKHFFQWNPHKNMLIPLQTEPSTSFSTKQKTKLGTDLLCSVYDSQETLQKGALNLLEQGNQLRNAVEKMEEIHEDLSVAERIARGIDSWLGRWRLPPSVKKEELILVKDIDIPKVWDIEVLCTKIIGIRHDNQNINVLRISLESVSIIDMKQKILHHFKWSDISTVKVVSPWEITVTQSFIGQDDLSFNIIGTSLPKLLPILEKKLGKKMNYLNPPEPHQDRYLAPTYTAPITSTFHLQSSGLTKSLASNPYKELDLQDEKDDQQISDAEFSELTLTLANLKSLASNIQSEQNDQLTTIDQLTLSVTKANDRIKVVNKIISKNNK